MQCLGKAFAIRQRKSIQFGEVRLKEHVFCHLQGSSRGCCDAGGGSREKKHPFSPALPFTEISPLPTAVIYLY